MHTSYDLTPNVGFTALVSHKPGGRFLTYRELANKLIPYVKEMGCIYIELLLVTEHLFNRFWGYQMVCHDAPISRRYSRREIGASWTRFQGIFLKTSMS
ncbi:hypothetical protein [cyanobacterium endosymbiont of Rhopalodia gibberula]|uniref:hypothetical protein n=1 Tax=cyanobacterium endosymbiont of Rhopalodia gibberula TaxID=1763363 RepID=UPI000E6497B1|nr:hypothetical protein [cyanobacterium endosymbiont of Rhopalodia gibberula]